MKYCNTSVKKKNVMSNIITKGVNALRSSTGSGHVLVL